jgi:inorganic pyrophosphatase
MELSTEAKTMSGTNQTKRSAAGLDALPSEMKGCTLAVIEAKAGSRNKFKFTPELGALILHKVLPLGTSFPYCFGFVPGTLGEDGDPLDILLFMDEAAEPGTIVPCHLVGMIEAQQTEKRKTIRNDRLLAVADESDRYRECRKLADIDDEVLDEIEKFFVFYNEQRGTKFQPLRRVGRSAAQKAVKRAQRFAK